MRANRPVASAKAKPKTAYWNSWPVMMPVLSVSVPEAFSGQLNTSAYLS